MAAVTPYVAPIEDIRRYQMRALFDDLHEREGLGLEDHHCDLIKAALASVCNVASEVPDGSFWSGTILTETERVFDAYANWNGVKGEDKAAEKARKAALRKLRKKRQRLARRVHVNQFILKNEIDKKLVDDMHQAFGNVVKNAPDIFINLAQAMLGRPS